MKKIILTIILMSNISLFAFEYNSGFVSLDEFEDLAIKHNGV